MTIEIINNQHLMFQSVKDGRKYASPLGFMPYGAFDVYRKKSYYPRY